MRQLKVCLLTLFAVFSFAAVTAATAAALPEIHLLTTDSFPVTIVGSALGEAIATLSTALMALTANHVEVGITCEKLGSLCPYTADFKGIEVEGNKCNTAGDAAGEVLVTKNEAHLVWVKLSPLEVGVAFLVAKFTMLCGTVKVTIEGQMIGRLPGAEDMVDIEVIEGVLLCTKPGNGKQEVKEYYNDEEKLVKGILKVNLGLGNEAACEEVKEPLALEANKMFELLLV